MRTALSTFTQQDFAQACRLFLELAYPDGAATVPERLRPYCDIAPEAPLDDFLPNGTHARGIAEDLSKHKTGSPGYAFRLGSARYPHLKLRLHRVDHHGREVWVYSVDTHDRFHRAIQHPNAEEAEAWRQLVEQNRTLKHQIEQALSLAGFLTPTSLLRLDLTSPANP
jgi:hypothetical protein